MFDKFMYLLLHHYICYITMQLCTICRLVINFVYYKWSLLNKTSFEHLYRLNCNTTWISRPEYCVISAIGCEIWHRRLGHIFHEHLSTVKNVCNGIHFFEPKKIKGKQNRSSFKYVGKRAENVLNLIHFYVMDPINVSSFSGSQYISTFINDCSHKVFTV